MSRRQNLSFQHLDFLALNEHAPWPMAMMEGPRHTLRSVNSAFCQLIEKPAAQMVGHPFCELLPKEEECIKRLDRVYRTGKPEKHEELENPGAHLLFCSYTLWPVRAEGHTVGVMILVTETALLHKAAIAMNEALLLGSLHQHELTEEAQTVREKTARELAEKARLLDLTKDAIIVRDLEGKITLWNKGAEDLYGWTSEEVIGRDLQSLLQTKFPKPWEEIATELHRDGQFSCEVVQRARDGRRVPSLCRGVLDRETESILTSYTDITAIKTAEEALRAAHALVASRASQLEKIVETRTTDLRETVQQLETFSYSIVHDMRAPLRSMRSFAAFLRQEYGDKLDHQGRDYLQRITASATRMDALITDVLAYSRTASTEMELRRVDMDKLVTEIVEQYPQFQEKAESIHIEHPLPAARGNAALLTQIVSNLLGNALKFVPPNRAARVVVRGESGDGKVRLWVEDNGIGIAPEYREKIFGLFKRLHGPDQYVGTGVGLAIVRKAAERMGGKVGFESDLGVGSRFWVELKAPEKTSPAKASSELASH